MPKTYTAPQPFEELDHTADLGLRTYGRDPEETLARLVLALSHVLRGGGAVSPHGTVHVRAEPGERVLMAIDVLRELLYLFEEQGYVASSCEVLRFDSHAGTEARIEVGDFDPNAHAEGTDVKAVTLHAARFEPIDEGWTAQVVLDV